MIVRKHFEIGETAVTIVSEPEYLYAAQKSIFRSREVIQSFIERDPFFQITIEPYEPPEDAHPIIKRMCSASALAGVGPMASVAGVIAEEAVSRMIEAGSRQAVVDNGGDIALFLSEEIPVGIYAGEKMPGIGFKCTPRESMFGICTSSGTIGPSLSFGIANAATVVSSNATLADACATKLGNMVTSESDEEIENALDQILGIPGIEGAMVIIDGKIAMKGRLPEIIKADVKDDKISRIQY